MQEGLNLATFIAIGFVVLVLVCALVVGRKIVPFELEQQVVPGVKPYVPSEEVGIFGTKQVRFDELLAQGAEGTVPIQEEINLEVEKALKLAEDLWHEGAKEQTVEALQQALIVEKDNPDLLLALGDAYLNLGQTDKALQAFDRANRVLPGDVTVLVRMAEVLESVGNAAFALDLYNEILGINPEIAEATDAVHRLTYHN